MQEKEQRSVADDPREAARNRRGVARPAWLQVVDDAPAVNGLRPLTGEEVLLGAAEAADRHLRQNLGRVPLNDPLRPEIEARVSRRRGPGVL